MVKNRFFSCLKMHQFNGVLPKWVLLHQMEIGFHIFKLVTFSKFFDDLMSHIIREYAGKKWNNFWMFHYEKSWIFFCLLLWYSVFTYYQYIHILISIWKAKNTWLYIFFLSFTRYIVAIKVITLVAIKTQVLSKNSKNCLDYRTIVPDAYVTKWVSPTS